MLQSCKTLMYYHNQNIDTETVQLSYSDFPIFKCIHLHVCVFLVVHDLPHVYTGVFTNTAKIVSISLPKGPCCCLFIMASTTYLPPIN